VGTERYLPTTIRAFDDSDEDGYTQRHGVSRAKAVTAS
jgi:hypothetical protein